MIVRNPSEAETAKYFFVAKALRSYCFAFLSLVALSSPAFSQFEGLPERLRTDLRRFLKVAVETKAALTRLPANLVFEESGSKN